MRVEVIQMVVMRLTLMVMMMAAVASQMLTTVVICRFHQCEKCQHESDAHPQR